MLFFVVGSSGSGKTSCINDLKNRIPNAAIYDFDTIGVPTNPDKAWRQESTEKWLKTYLLEKQNDTDFILCGQIVLGEILACPSAEKLGKVNICLLDVSDIERMRRLTGRSDYNNNDDSFNQDILNWAAWLRMHHANPQWHQSVIKDHSWSGLNFSRWDNLTSWKDLANVVIIDNTYLNILETATAIKSCIDSLKC